MMLWVVFAALTAAAVMTVLWPLSRGRAVSAGGSDVVVYKDQLAEIERDAAAGLIGQAEAEAARIEVSRRLLAAANAEPRGFDGEDGRRRLAAIVAIVVIPLVVMGVYGWRGSPNLPGQPLAERMRAPEADQDVATLVARIESHLAANPDDGRGWEILAPVYARLGRAAEAVRARASAIRILGATPDRETDYGEALAIAAQGVITADAKAAFQRALVSDPRHPKALYFTALAAEQDGSRDDAIAILRRVETNGPTDAPWLPMIRREIARLSGPAAPGPTAEDVDAARTMPPAEQQAMIRGMVDRLASRLSLDFSDFDGWTRLIRAYMVLGEHDKAREALTQARRHFAADPEKVGRLDALTRDLRIGG